MVPTRTIRHLELPTLYPEHKKDVNSKNSKPANNAAACVTNDTNGQTQQNAPVRSQLHGNQCGNTAHYAVSNKLQESMHIYYATGDLDE